MSLAATRLQALRHNTSLDKNMVRPNQFGVLDYFIQQGAQDPLISRQAKSGIFGSMGRDVQLPVLNYNGEVTVSNARSCTIPDAENTSALVDVTFKTYQVGVSMTPSLYQNNEISYQRDFQRKVLDAVRALGNAMDKDALAAVVASKSQVFNEKLSYTVTGNSVQVPYIQRVDILGDIDALMAANGFTGRIGILGNYGVQALVAKLAQLGAQNSINKILEYAGKDFFTSINIANEDGKYATLYAVENGNVDLVTRVDREAFAGTQTRLGHEWGVTTLPGLNIPVGFHYYQEVGDKSAIAGDASADMTCVLSEKYGFSVDVAFITAYNSDPTKKASPFIEAEIATGTGAGVPVNVNGTVTTGA